MQKILKFSVFVFLSVYVFLQTKEKPIVTNELLLENVEALAYEEYEFPILCNWTGDITCPNGGEKVLDVYELYSLDSDEETY